MVAKLRLVAAKPRKVRSDQIAAVSAAVRTQLGSVPRRIRAIPTLEDDLVYEVALPTGTVIFKAAPPGREGTIALEAWACQRVRRAGVPAPRILGLDISGKTYPGAYLLQAKVPGIPLSGVGPRRRRRWQSLIQAGSYLRLIHEIKLDGFGWLDGPLYVRRGKIKGHYRRWSDAVLRPIGPRLIYLARHGVLDRKDIHRIRQIIEEHRKLFRHPEKARLLHGDFGSSYMFVDPGTGKVTGIIDFADRKAGDPLWDIAWFTIWQDQQDFHDLIAGYGCTREQVDESAVRFRLYVLLQAVGDVVWLHERRQKTRPHVRAIRAALTSLIGRGHASLNGRTEHE